MASAKPAGEIVAAVVGITILAALAATVGVTLYAARMQQRAAALVQTAREIRTTGDAERAIEDWRRRAGPGFWQESDHLGGDHNFDGQIENLALARFGIVKPASLLRSVTTNDGKLRCITLLMNSERQRNVTAGVWLQEWFDQDGRVEMHVSAKNKPVSAAVDFTASLSDETRERALNVNTKCLVSLQGCGSAQEILPAIWELESQSGSSVRPRLN